MGVEVEIKMEGFLKALKDYPTDMSKNLRIASKREASRVELDAKKTHRFTTRTGRLVKSIKGYGDSKVGGRTFVSLILHDEGHQLGTKYGKYVHNGQRSWGADKFIEKSMERNKGKIYKAWQAAIDKTSKGF